MLEPLVRLKKAPSTAKKANNIKMVTRQAVRLMPKRSTAPSKLLFSIFKNLWVNLLSHVLDSLRIAQAGVNQEQALRQHINLTLLYSRQAVPSRILFEILAQAVLDFLRLTHGSNKNQIGILAHQAFHAIGSFVGLTLKGSCSHILKA